MKYIVLFTIFIECLIKKLNSQDNLIKTYESEIYGRCDWIKCSLLETCSIEGGKCQNEKCICNDWYTTYTYKVDHQKRYEIYKCCYKQKSKLTAVVLEFVIGFGLGHFYVGNYLLGGIKFIIYVLFFSFTGYILMRVYKERKKEKTFFFKMTCISSLLGCSCTYIVWQIIDVILFIIGSYKDGNGQSLN